jgi:hypothetical protein
MAPVAEVLGGTQLLPTQGEVGELKDELTKVLRRPCRRGLAYPCCRILADSKRLIHTTSSEKAPERDVAQVEDMILLFSERCVNRRRGRCAGGVRLRGWCTDSLGSSTC